MMAHGGLVTVADNAGSGATFTLVFPAQGDPESNARCLT